MTYLCLWVYMNVPGVCRGQKKVADSLELKFQVNVSCCVPCQCQERIRAFAGGASAQQLSHCTSLYNLAF